MFPPFDSLPNIGAFCLGFLLGWLLYYINRHRSGAVTLVDFGVIVGVVAGGAVSGFLGKSATLAVNPETFGAYCIGLLVGFLAYLVILIILVRMSQGEYDSLFFLDGRRLVPDPKYDVPERSTVRPFGLSNKVLAQQLADLETPEPGDWMLMANSTSAAAMTKLTAAIQSLQTAILELDIRQSTETNNSKRDQLNDKLHSMQMLLSSLQAKQALIDFNSQEVKDARQQLLTLSGRLTAEASKMKSATNALNQAAKIIGAAEKLIGLVGGLA